MGWRMAACGAWMAAAACAPRGEDPGPRTPEKGPPTATGLRAETGLDAHTGADTAPGDSGGAPPPHLESVTVSDNPLLVLEKRFAIALSGPDAVGLVCQHPSLPEERHVLAGPAADHHELVLRGLLENTHYDCAVTTAGRPGAPWQLGIDVAPIPHPMPTLEVGGSGVGMAGAYTLFNHFRHSVGPVDAKVLVVDPDGRVRWYHRLQPQVRGVSASQVGAEVLLVGGGGGTGDPANAYPPSFIGLSTDLQFRFPDPELDGAWHHEALSTADGNVVGMATALNEANGMSWMGFAIEKREAMTGTLLWSWNSQQAIDAGQLPIGRTHANAVSEVVDDAGLGYWVSLKRLNQIVRVDADDGDVTWSLGVGRDFTLVDAVGDPVDDEAAWFYGQHNPHVALPRVLLYDNGDGRPGEPKFSRALELHVDVPARTARVVWEYRLDDWFEPLWGDVDLLPNGNVLVAIGHCWTCGGGSQTTAIHEVDPQTQEVVWRLDLPLPVDALYRAERLDGCAMFANAAYCGAL